MGDHVGAGAADAVDAEARTWRVLGGLPDGREAHAHLHLGLGADRDRRPGSREQLPLVRGVEGAVHEQQVVAEQVVLVH